MISDEQIEKGIMAFVFHCEVKVGPAQAGWMYDALLELKQRRESDLRPATKFLGQDFATLFKKISEEYGEVRQAFDKGNGDINRLAEELVDLQMTCETMLAKAGLNELDRQKVRRQVIEKNRRRGYYEGAASNKSICNSSNQHNSNNFCGGKHRRGLNL